MVNYDDHIQLDSYEEEDVIIRVINENIQQLTDSQEDIQKAIVRLKKSLQALRDYHSRDTIIEVLGDKDVPF